VAEPPDVPRPDSRTSADPANAAKDAAPTAEHEWLGRSKRAARRQVHEVTFVTYPKLLFIWPLILAGLLFAPFGSPEFAEASAQSQVQEQSAEQPEAAEAPPASPAPAVPPASPRMETFGWVYIFVIFVVLLTLGVDVDRNQFIFWVVLILGLWIGGRWLADVKGFTLFGDIYKWFAWLDVQYNRSLGLALSLILLVPYLLMIAWAHINDKWRITHNEFEHHSLGKSDDSLGRGAKTIRTSYPDVLELLLGLAGTLTVYNATGTKELRRIPHVMLLPFVRKRLDRILERTAVTAAITEEEEDDEEES
jgi:hypothetical protein